MKVFESKRDVVWGAGGLLLTLVAYLIGASVGRNATFDATVVAAAAKAKLQSDSAYQESVDSLAKNNSRLAKLDGFETRVAALQSAVSSNQKDLGSVKDELAAKRAELESLTARVEKIRSQPVELPAGHFLVGRDIRPGRYTVLGSSNFIVNGANGELKHNIVLGGDFGVERYVCDLDEGDEIEAGGADSFYPMN